MTIDLGSGSLDKCVLRLQQASGFSFAYESSGLQGFTVEARSFKNAKLSHILHDLLQGSGYIFEEKHHVIVIGPAAKVQGSDAYQFKGVIEDKETGMRLEGVAVYDARSKSKGTFTDENGYFSLTASSDTLKLRLSYLSYRPVEVMLRADDAPLIRIRMNVAREGLDSVLVSDPADISPFSPLSRITLSPKKLSFLPRFCGDIDLISMLKITPGIQEAADGSGAIIVRGGAPDQNLLLIDDVNIYGATHLFGLLSSVNSSAVKDISVYKGSFSARFGGRISSVWDISLKDGDPEKYHGMLSLGTMASDFMFEGPIVKEKTTFMIAGRRSYHDLYTRLFTRGLNDFYFQDLNVKLHHKFSEKDHLYFTGYLSKDRFNMDGDTTISEEGIKTSQSITLNTENKAAALRWRHDYTPNLISNFSVSYSSYDLLATNKIASVYPLDREIVLVGEEQIRTGLYDLTAKFDVTYQPHYAHQIETGVYYTRHTFNPYNYTLEYSASDTTGVLLPPKYEDIVRDTASIETGFYLEDNISVTDNFKAAIGFHLNRYVYDGKSYFSFQPRINLRYRLHKNWNLNGSYVRMQQNLHRMSMSQTSLPLDFWIPSTGMIKPQTSDQLSVGLFGKLFGGALDVSIEGYYKSMNNVAEYLAFNNDTSNRQREVSWSQEVATGKGSAYGIEFSLHKTKGNFNGWLSYALAWSNRTLPEVNDGLTFPYKYDRRHNLNLVGVYKLGKSWELSAIFSFQSKPKPPVLILKSNDHSFVAEQLREYAATTNIRAYHRLDLGVSWIWELKEGVSGIWNLSLLNAYNRQNTFFFLSENNKRTGRSLLPVSAALSYTLKF